MTRHEMLRRMGLSEEEFRHLTHRFRTFYNELDEREKAVIRRSMPTMDQAARSFGPDVRIEDLQELFGFDASAGVFNSEIAGNQPNNGNNDDGGDH